MAEVTKTLVKYNTAGALREDIYEVAGGYSDADVLTTRLQKVVAADWIFTDTATVAADSVAVEILPKDASNPTARVRLQIAGTARAGTLVVRGY